MKVPFIQGKTNTGGALERAQQMLADGRPSVPKIILLITDGDATDKERLDAQIEKLKKVRKTSKKTIKLFFSRIF